MRIICSLIFFFPSIFFAQTDSVSSNKGDLLSVNEIGINKLILKYEKILKKRNGINGWRVQLKFKAKEAEIVKLKSKFIKNSPDISIYLMYDEPYYKIRVGNYKNTQVFNVGGIKVKVLYIYLCIYMGKINCSPKNFF